MKNVELSLGNLWVTTISVNLCLVTSGHGAVFGRKVKVLSEFDGKSDRVSLLLIIEGNDIATSALFTITPDDFHTLAKHLPADCIDDRLNLLKNNEDQKKGAFVATDQVTTKAVTLNDMTMSTGE